MTGSWDPSPEAVTWVRVNCPNVQYAREADAFKDWHIGKGDGVVKTGAQWDALWRNWCARKQSEWEAAHPTSNGVRFDETTGMPINPKPPVFDLGQEREKGS